MVAHRRHWQSSSGCQFTVAYKPIWLLTVCTNTEVELISSWCSCNTKTVDWPPSSTVISSMVCFITCVPFTFTVGWFLVHYWEDQRWGYHIIVLLYMYILKLEFYHQIAIPKLPVFYKLSWRKKLFGAKTTYIPPFFPRLSLSYLYNPPPSVKHSDLAGSSTTQP